MLLWNEVFTELYEIKARKKSNGKGAEKS